MSDNDKKGWFIAFIVLFAMMIFGFYHAFNAHASETLYQAEYYTELELIRGDLQQIYTEIQRTNHYIDFASKLLFGILAFWAIQAVYRFFNGIF